MCTDSLPRAFTARLIYAHNNGYGSSFATTIHRNRLASLALYTNSCIVVNNSIGVAEALGEHISGYGQKGVHILHDVQPRRRVLCIFRVSTRRYHTDRTIIILKGLKFVRLNVVKNNKGRDFGATSKNTIIKNYPLLPTLLRFESPFNYLEKYRYRIFKQILKV